MKSTRLKISVSQDGLLPQETAEIATLEFPTLPKKLLKALGFERVDSKTYVGVLPVFINLGEKEQEIELELGVNLPEMRKKIIDIVKTPARLIAVAEAKSARAATTKKKAPQKEAEAVAEKAPPAKKTASRKKKPATKTTDKPKTTAAKRTTKTTKTKTTATKKTAAKSTPAKKTTTKTKRAKKG